MRTIILLVFFIFILSAHAQRSDFKTIDFWRAEYIAEQHKGEELYNLPDLVHGLTAQLTSDVERFRAIYLWVCYNIKGDYYMMNESDRMHRKLQSDPTALQQWNQKFKKEIFSRLLKDKTTLCTGYAYLIKALANLANLNCEIVHGYGPTTGMKINNGDVPNHSWNAIQLDGKWYLCDATWSSGLIDMSTLMFEANYDDSYFLMEPNRFLESHQPIDKRWELISVPVD